MNTELPAAFERKHRLSNERWDKCEFTAFAMQIRALGGTPAGQ